MKFDESETWRTDAGGILWWNVFNHEWGHIIGLVHSRVRTALMAPIYSANVAVPQSPDDVERAVQIFGPNTGGGGTSGGGEVGGEGVTLRFKDGILVQVL